MRKTFITPEYSSSPINGTMNQSEIKSFFQSKILQIEDEMIVSNSNISWTESIDGTQNIRLEDVNKIFDTFQVKKDNHSMIIYKNQSEQQKKEFTQWELTINIREIINQYIHAQLKANRTFENIDNINTYNNSVDKAIYQYINDNVYPRIKFSNIILYVKYYQIGEVIGVNSDNSNIIALQYDATFNQNIIQLDVLNGESISDYNKRLSTYKNTINVKNFQITTDPQENVANVIYKQTLSSLNYKFDYYFDVVWKLA